jgi:hypothetical protein
VNADVLGPGSRQPICSPNAAETAVAIVAAVVPAAVEARADYSLPQQIGEEDGHNLPPVAVGHLDAVRWVEL